MKKTSVFNLNHKKHSTAFFFQALFSALILAVAFLIDDVIDNVITANSHGPHQRYIILAVHTIVIFALSFVVLYILRWIFGWGDTFLG